MTPPEGYVSVAFSVGIALGGLLTVALDHPASPDDGLASVLTVVSVVTLWGYVLMVETGARYR